MEAVQSLGECAQRGPPDSPPAMRQGLKEAPAAEVQRAKAMDSPAPPAQQAAPARLPRPGPSMHEALRTQAAQPQDAACESPLQRPRPAQPEQRPCAGRAPGRAVPEQPAPGAESRGPGGAPGTAAQPEQPAPCAPSARPAGEAQEVLRAPGKPAARTVEVAAEASIPAAGSPTELLETKGAPDVLASADVKLELEPREARAERHGMVWLARDGKQVDSENQHTTRLLLRCCYAAAAAYSRVAAEDLSAVVRRVLLLIYGSAATNTRRKLQSLQETPQALLGRGKDANMPCGAIREGGKGGLMKRQVSDGPPRRCVAFAILDDVEAQDEAVRLLLRICYAKAC